MIAALSPSGWLREPWKIALRTSFTIRLFCETDKSRKSPQRDF